MKYILQGLSCADCAGKIENELSNIEGIGRVGVNFATGSVSLDPQFETAARSIVKRIEPGAELVPESWPNHGGQGLAVNAKRSFQLQLLKIILAVLLLTAAVLSRSAFPAVLPFYLLSLSAYLLAGGYVIRAAAVNLIHGKLFDEHFLMTVATIGAIAINNVPEAVAVMLFYSTGRLFQDHAVNRARGSISALMGLRPDYARLIKDGVEETVSPGEVSRGDLIRVRPGEKVPLDGEVIEGGSYLDTSSLTGETAPRWVEPGDPVLSGSINDAGLLTIKVNREYSESSVARILKLVEDAAARKAPVENFITTFARRYTPAVLAAALLTAAIPPLVTGAPLQDWLYRALVLLVISCPCALVISIPLGYFGGIGRASRLGILIKGASCLDALTRVHTVAFDKTGTLTRGEFEVLRVVTINGFTREEVLNRAALAGSYSGHPVARSIVNAARNPVDDREVEEAHEYKGYGVKIVAGGKTILAGSARLMIKEGIDGHFADPEETAVYVAVDGRLAGHIILVDSIKESAAGAMKRLKELGVHQTVMLSGDSCAATARVAGETGIDRYFGRLLPEEKVSEMYRLKENAAAGRKNKVAFAGDGINDAPVLMLSDIGIAMGAEGNDAAMEAADIVIMDSDPARVPLAMEVARFTRKIVIQNIALALGFKGIFLILGILGAATMWEAVFADVGVTLLAIFNATRTLRFPGTYREIRPGQGSSLAADQILLT